jgi:hypothetical protein
LKQCLRSESVFSTSHVLVALDEPVREFYIRSDLVPERVLWSLTSLQRALFFTGTVVLPRCDYGPRGSHEKGKRVGGIVRLFANGMQRLSEKGHGTMEEQC